jgi:hypothetical protein
MLQPRFEHAFSKDIIGSEPNLYQAKISPPFSERFQFFQCVYSYRVKYNGLHASLFLSSRGTLDKLRLAFTSASKSIALSMGDLGEFWL